MKKILPFFSYLFHPLFTGIFAALFYFYHCERHFEYQIVYLYLIQILLLTVFVPLGVFYLLISLGKIDSIMVSKVSERKIPLLIHILLLNVLIQFSITREQIPELYFFFLASIISSLIALVFIFFKIKSSLHMLGMATLTVFFIGLSVHFNQLNYVVIAILLLCNGIVATSRLYMKAHTYFELFLGYLIGLIPQVIFLWYWL